LYLFAVLEVLESGTQGWEYGWGELKGVKHTAEDGGNGHLTKEGWEMEGYGGNVRIG
jgi:hypothetical protein